MGTSLERPPAASFHMALLIVRVVAGIIFAAHGAQKLFGAFGGSGLAGTVQMMGPIGYLVAVGEFFGGLGLVVGFLSRFSAASLSVIMLGAIVIVHWPNGFFLGQNPGWEFNFSLLGLLLPVVFAGPGSWAIGRMLPLPKRRGSERPVVWLE